MNTEKSKNRAEKLAEKIAALEAQLSEIKAEEKSKMRAAAAKELARVAKKSGVLALLRGGAVTAEKLEAEFRFLAGRLKDSQRTEPEVDTTDDVQEQVAGKKNERNSFWSR